MKNNKSSTEDPVSLTSNWNHWDMVVEMCLNDEVELISSRKWYEFYMGKKDQQTVFSRSISTFFGFSFVMFSFRKKKLWLDEIELN